MAKVLPIDGITVVYTIQPQDVFEMYAERLKLWPEAVVVGTSLGGFYAAWLGAEFDRTFIAINASIVLTRTEFTKREVCIADSVSFYFAI